MRNGGEELRIPEEPNRARRFLDKTGHSLFIQSHSLDHHHSGIAMRHTGRATSELRRLKRSSARIGITWTMMIAGLLVYEFYHERQRTEEMAFTHARAMVERYIVWIE